MQVLKIEQTSSSPQVLLDHENGKFEFSGRSLPEDPIEFYEPVVKWFEEYQNNALSDANFVFKLTYFNTASSKVFFNLFQMIDAINVKNAEANNRIVIYTNEDDEDLVELFEYYKELLTSNCLDLKIF